MRFEALQEFLRSRGQLDFRLRQVARAIYGEGVPRFAEITTLPRHLREELDKKLPLLSLQAESLHSSSDGTQKAVLRLRDGLRIESVLMSPKPGLRTACISSQVGCALGCTFCATGLMGFKRNLSEEEITDQVLYWVQRLKPGRLTNIVYMGMGEPFLNLPNVLASLRTLTDPALFGFGRRHISVSTVGIAPGIERFGLEFPQVNLALSLHAATNDERSRLVPVNRAYPLQRLREALKAYLSKTNRKVFIEYTLLRGENDSPQHAERLAGFLKSVGPAKLLHVNLIVWNPTDTPHQASRADDARRFKERLLREGVPATIRKNLGRDIEGACGQLVL